MRPRCSFYIMPLHPWQVHHLALGNRKGRGERISSLQRAVREVPSEGFEGVKFLPQLHNASSTEGPAPKASIMPRRRPKREVPKPGKLVTFIGVNSREICTKFERISHEFT